MKELLLRQFRLHELGLHPPRDTEKDRERAVRPLAHTLADVYKLLHQGEFGVGHLIQNPAEFRERLLKELFRAKPQPAEQAAESVTLDGSVWRINLRPLRSLFLGRENEAAVMLQDVCLESVSMIQGDPDRFMETLGVFRELNNSGELVLEGLTFLFPPREVGLFLDNVVDYRRTMGGLPVLGHSQVYHKLNRPSYRVAAGEALRNSRMAHMMPQ